MQLKNLFFACLVLVASIAIGLGGCARVVPPTGGDKDTLAPRLVRSIPAAGSRNFQGNVVVLEFDEDVNVNNINQQLVISPLQENTYTYKIRRRRVELTFEKPFPDSATVFLNFRNGIVDLNEKTPAKDLRLAFATGEALDTLRVSGTVTDLLTGKPMKEVTVGLWPNSDTTDIRRQKPQYLGQTDEGGSFRLENIRKGRYQLAAIADYNGNAKWSGKRESVGFLSEPLQVISDTAVALSISRVDEEKPRMDKLSPASKAQAEVRFGEGLSRLDAYLGKDSLPRQPADNSGALYRIYLPKPWADTLRIRLVAVDSAGNVRDTLARLAPYKAPRDAKPDTGKLPVMHLNTVAALGSGGYFLPATAALTLPEPMPFGTEAPSFVLRGDSLKKTEKVKSAFTLYRNQLALPLPYVQAKTYYVYTPKGLKTATGSPIADDTLDLSIATEEQVGLIRGKLVHPAKHTILELLNDQGVAMYTLYDVSTFELTGLPPGTYTFRLTLDTNGNRQRDPAVYSKRFTGEPVLPPSTPVQVKANWEVEVGSIFGQ